MNKSKAADVANEISRMVAQSMPDTWGEDVYERIKGAVIDHACELIPETDLAAVIQHGKDKTPMLVVLDGQQLFMLSVGKVDDGIDQPPTSCEMVHVEPGAGTVNVVSQYRGRAAGQSAPHSTTWLFKLADGADLAIHGFVSPRTGQDDRETFARGLARCLGWNPPDPDSGAISVAA